MIEAAAMTGVTVLSKPVEPKRLSAAIAGAIAALGYATTL
jgi:hypothetical protein